MTSSSTSRMRCGGGPGDDRLPQRRSVPFCAISIMKPTLPSKPTALPTIGRSKSCSRPPAASAPRIVASVLLEMMPSWAPASRSARRCGSSMWARSHISACFRLRTCRSPGVAVSVPSKSKKMTSALPEIFLKELRSGAGVSGPRVVSGRLAFSDERDPERLKLIGRRATPEWVFGLQGEELELLSSKSSPSPNVGGEDLKSEIAAGRGRMR
mmetsp:Transcript_42569/g.109935  ORF Transcript_42569/g.109935 Transcript_42569/m.109935 type:complete len:212 (-) Transcript_42569:255-890(-)